MTIDLQRGVLDYALNIARKLGERIGPEEHYSVHVERQHPSSQGLAIVMDSHGPNQTVKASGLFGTLNHVREEGRDILEVGCSGNAFRTAATKLQEQLIGVFSYLRMYQPNGEIFAEGSLREVK